MKSQQRQPHPNVSCLIQLQTDCSAGMKKKKKTRIGVEGGERQTKEEDYKANAIIYNNILKSLSILT